MKNSIRNRISMGLVLALAIVGLSGVVTAQDSSPRSAYLPGVDLKTVIEAARAGLTKDVRGIKTEEPDGGETNVVFNPNLTGTWNVTVTGAGPNPFYSMQTFNGGTFTETSSQLGLLHEGPAHGVYSCGTHFCNLTFETFEFDPDGIYWGKIRLRALITQNSTTTFSADYSVDFIELDGTVIPDIGSGTFSAVKMQVLGL
jgi:hypothetical protein